VKAKKKFFRLTYPLMVIGIGVVFIVTKTGSYGSLDPIQKGRHVIFIGVLCCALGVWGLFRTLQELRKKEEPNQPTETTRGNGPDFE
jgi:hypothetical protein